MLLCTGYGDIVQFVECCVHCYIHVFSKHRMCYINAENPLHNTNSVPMFINTSPRILSVNLVQVFCKPAQCLLQAIIMCTLTLHQPYNIGDQSLASNALKHTLDKVSIDQTGHSTAFNHCKYSHDSNHTHSLMSICSGNANSL